MKKRTIAIVMTMLMVVLILPQAAFGYTYSAMTSQNTVYSDGTKSYYDYEYDKDGFNSRTSGVDAFGDAEEVLFTYDANHNLIKIVETYGDSTTTTEQKFNANSVMVEQVITGNDYSSKYLYDANGNQTYAESKYKNGDYSIYKERYDNNGNMIYEESATCWDGVKETYVVVNEYDGSDRLVKQVYTSNTADGVQTDTYIYKYDKDGNTVYEKNAHSGVYNCTDEYNYTYDEHGNTLSCIQDSVWESETPTHYETYYTYEYDAAGNMTKRIETDGANVVVWTENYTYDANGTLRRSDSKTEYSTSYILYDASGNMTESEYTSTDFDGKVSFWSKSKWVYNSNGQCIREDNSVNDYGDRSNSVATHTYDATGNLTQTVVMDDSGRTVTTYTYRDIQLSYFKDVALDSYYLDAVEWAFNYGVTTGTSADSFSPDATCTRGQVVTFLWRSLGCPEPTTTNNPFTDVKATDYYYDAVLWAVENGITAGTSATTFSPKATCTNGHVLTFLWRAQQEPAAKDVSALALKNADQWYTDALAWADTEKIMHEAGNLDFDPKANCSRADIVYDLFMAPKM